MLITETVDIAGTDYRHNYSDNDMRIEQEQTGYIYDDAIDALASAYTYSETDEPIEDDVQEWTQPTGTIDAYMYGDVVLYDGIKYVSTCDTNVWQPGTFGWELFSE